MASGSPLLPADRPPYRAAAAAGLLVWLGYVITLAPTVTLWDAGELISAAKTLGIPHPPGTPLFVVLANAWGTLVALGEYAWRLNLMSATFSAAGAAAWFLVVHRVLAGEAPLVRLGGAAAAACASAFALTPWQNSNETEVYMVATFSIAAIAWLCFAWRDARGTERGAHYLVLIAYLEALSIGTHLLTLLVGPAVSVFVWHVLRSAPADEPRERRTEWSEWAVLSALWVALVAVGLGNMPLLLAGGALFAGATAYALAARSWLFPLVTLAVGATGISTYGYLYVRSALDPLLDMADPETWDRLVAVIRREQYPVRRPWDHPLFLAAPDNPGRTPLLFFQQLVNYLQYFNWQWGRALGAASVAMTALFAALGIAGFGELRRRDRSAAWLLGTLWLVTGLGMVVYMNFKAGFSLFWDQYPDLDQHEVRERDYFFVASFQAWGLFAALGLAALARRAAAAAGPRAAVTVLALSLAPLALNFGAASRRHGPDATLARDFAYNMLQSVEPYGILFSFGDNDTYPLWYAQEVEGVRQDVVNVNLSLANLDWYIRQLRARPVRPFDPARAPALYPREGAPPPPPTPVLDLPDALIDALRPVRPDRDFVFRAGDLALPLRRGQVVNINDQVILTILQQQLPAGRPVTFGLTSGRGSWLGLDPFLVGQGLAFKVVPGRPDTLPGIRRGVQATLVDVPRTEDLVDGTFRFGRLFDADTLELEPAAQRVVASLAIPFLELGNAHAFRGDQVKTLQYFRRAQHLAPSAGLARLIARIEQEGLERVLSEFADSANSRAPP